MYDYEYVSLEVARIIKEKGFCEECRCFYQSIREDDKDEDCFRYADNFPFKNRKEDNKRFAAPTLPQLQSWLMINHNIFISYIFERPSVLSDDVVWKYSITTNLSDAECLVKFSDIYYSNLRNAMNKGFLEALKLI